MYKQRRDRSRSQSNLDEAVAGPQIGVQIAPVQKTCDSGARLGTET
jgi:hypothetical protein